VPAHVRRKLSKDIQQDVEESISGYGDYLVRVFDEIDPATGKFTHGRTERKVVIGGRTYEASVYGHKLGMTTKLNIALRGVALDGVIALAESPVRVLEDDERDAFTVTEGIDVEVGGQKQHLDDQEQLDRLKEKLKKQELTIGPVSTGAVNKEALGADGSGVGADAVGGGDGEIRAESVWTEGAKTLLFMRVDFSDMPGEPVDAGNTPLTVARAQTLINTEVNNFYKANSYNKTSITGTVIPVVLRMPQTAAFYGANNSTQLLIDARAAAKAAGYDTALYSLDVVAFKRISGFSWAGLGYIGAKGTWLNGYFSLREAGHELGHNYGLSHANLWETGAGGTVIGAGSSQEYGDPFDCMGAGNVTQANHFNAWFKNLLNWLPDADVSLINAAGTYRIQAYDSVSSTGKRALKIQRDAATFYWVEFRQALAANVSVYNGAVIHWGYSTNKQSNLLDMTYTTATADDAALGVGQTFIDTANGIQIKTISKSTTLPATIDVSVSFTTNLNTVTVNPAALVGGSTSTGTVTLNAPAPALGAVVTLSDNLAATTLPASVTIPAGATSKTFSIASTAVTALQSGLVTASYLGVNKTAALSVSPVALSTLTLNNASVGGGATVTGTVVLNGPAPALGATVTLSDNLAAATTPVNVVIPAGTTTKTFSITTVPVTLNQVGAVTANYGGVTKTSPLTVGPVALSALTISPASTAGGIAVTGTVWLNGPAPAAGAIITLSDNLPATTIPVNVTVPAGVASKTFTITTAIVAANQTGTVTATWGAVSKTAALTIRPPELLSLTLTPASVAGGNNVAGTVSLDGPAPATGAVVTLSDNLTQATTPLSVAIPSGAKSANFTITTVLVTAKWIGAVTATRGAVTKTAALTVRPVSVQSITVNPNPIPGGSSAQGTITLERLSATPTVVTLSDTLPATTIPASVTIPANVLSATFPVTTTFAIPSQTGVLSATANTETRTLSLRVVNTALQLLSNPGFELGAVSWVTNDPNKVFYAGNMHTGTRSGWLGGYLGAFSNYLYQDVTIPANATSVNLNFWLLLMSDETTVTVPANDTLRVQVRNTAGTILSTQAVYTYQAETAGYVKKTFNLLPYKGQTIRIYFVSDQNSTLNSWYFLDDVTLDVVQ
jgi:hypothetical protein